jgi:hypothetical protein
MVQAAMVCGVVGVAIGCDVPEKVVETTTGPTAGVRFINAVPDTQALDFRFVDMPENSAHWNIGFRNNPVTGSCVTGSSLIQYKPARAGSRRFKIFLNDTIQAVASQFLKDTTVTLEAGKLYTALLWGYAGSTPAMQLTFMEDNPPDPGDQVAVRVLNATGNTYDVRHYVPSNTTNNVPPAATWAGVGPLTATSYVMVDPGSIRFNTQPAGGATLVADALALPGSAAPAIGFDAIPGTTVAGSAVTAVIFPLSVAGSKGVQADPPAPSTGSTNLAASPAGYSRNSGSFISNCFYVGASVTASGFTNAANNGTSTVTAITSSRNTGSISMSATATGYARASGDFVDDGFTVGMWIDASGFATAANNGRSVITAVDATTITVTKSTPTVAEAAGSGRALVSDQLLRVSKTVPPVAEARASNRTVAGVLPSAYTSFFWDRRPPRS